MTQPAAPAPGETIEVMAGPLPPGARWNPVVGEETLQVLERMSDLDDVGKTKVQNEAIEILARCMPPDQINAKTTGLVLGQVQSGKTMSFTTVTALSRDNGYRIVIVVTGTTVPLLEQSAARLRRDLGLEQANRHWKHIQCVPKTIINRAAISDALDEWRDLNVAPKDRQSVLITVMKQHQNLQKVIDVLRTLPLGDVPTLVIDDEADQASLNTKVQTNEESTTYDKLRDLRDCLSRHTFLQYTATPQALLLISIINILSPAFAEMLTPGDEYTGGKGFFIDHPNLVREIPSAEVPTKSVPLSDPPESLFFAMRLFFLGVAAGMESNDGGNRSMLVHPSVTRAEHAQFHQWVLAAKDEWKDILGKAADDADRVDLINEFRPAYDDLSQTLPGLPSFEELSSRLVLAIRRTQVEKVNAAPGKTPSIDWNHSYSFILVGGAAMDRGYTVRGLTVTYMPRGLGGGNADTVQQRARFFGYKQSYLGYCRVYLESDVLAAFRDYVEHEQDVRGRLQTHRSSGRPLTDWPRSFILDRAMQPTRNNVIDIPYQRRRFGDDWFIAKAPHDSPDAVGVNRTLVAALRQRLTFLPDQGNVNRTEHQKHLVSANVALGEVFEQFLAPFRFTRFHDSQNYVSLLLLLKTVLDQKPDVVATVYLMSQGATRERSVGQNDEIPTLFQGQAPVNPASQRGTIYPGDEAIKDSSVITIQIHMLTVKRPNESLTDVPTLALWMPAAFARDIVVQPQGAAVSNLLKQVIAALSELHRPDPAIAGGRVFAGVKYPASQFHRLGKDASGHIAVLLALDPAIQDGPLPPVVLENISVVHSANCRVSDGDGNLESGTYTVVSCTSDDKYLVRHFVTLMSSLVLSLPDRPSCQTAAAALQRMIRLFRSLKRPSTRSIQGLWAELFVIRMAHDAKAMVRAWRADPLERFDFASMSDRLEVKSTKWTRRCHQFSLEQLRTHGDIRVIVASVQVASLANGLTLARLWHEVRSRVEDDAKLLLYVDQVVTTSLGRTWRRGLDFGFDESIARNTLAFYDAPLIPAIDGVLPTEVSEVRFRSDLSAISALSPDAMRAMGPLFRAAQTDPV